MAPVHSLLAGTWAKAKFAAIKKVKNVNTFFMLKFFINGLKIHLNLKELEFFHKGTKLLIFFKRINNQQFRALSLLCISVSSFIKSIGLFSCNFKIWRN